MFPGANADPAGADYVVVGAPLDASTTFEPGARFGPRRVRHFATPFDDYDQRTGSRFTDLSVADHGDVGPTDDVEEYLHFLEGTVGDYAEDDAVPSWSAANTPSPSPASARSTRTSSSASTPTWTSTRPTPATR